MDLLLLLATGAVGSWALSLSSELTSLAVLDPKHLGLE